MKYLTSIAFCLFSSLLMSQNAYDLIVTGSFSPSTVEVGEASEYQLEICNFTLTGATIPSERQSLTVVIGAGAVPNAASPPTGNFGVNFDWTFITPNIWYGVSTAPMPFGCGYTVNVPVTATEVSSNASNYDGNIVAPDSDNQPANDTGSARLQVSAMLPVEFASVDVSTTDCSKAQISWGTVSELNNEGFTVQRKTDLSNDFIDLGFVSAKSTAGADYLYTDDLTDISPKAKNLYYRLEQVDFDGRTKFSEVVTTDLDCGKALTMEGFPNPAIDRYTVAVSGLTSPANLKIHNMQGEVVKVLAIEDQSKLDIDLLGLVPGTYNLGLYSGTGELLQSQRLIKLK